MGCTSSKHRSGRDEDLRSAPFSRCLPIPNNGPGDHQLIRVPSFKLEPEESAGFQADKCSNVHVPLLKPINKETLRSEGVLCSIESSSSELESSHKMKKRRLQDDSFAQITDVGIGSDWFNDQDSPDFGFGEDVQPLHRPTRSFTFDEHMLGNEGLRLLLSPVVTPKHAFMPSVRAALLSKSLSLVSKAEIAPSCTPCSDGTPTDFEWTANAGDTEKHGSPLFDPLILATFEKALETASDDNWLSSEDVSSSSSSSRNLFSSSSEACSDVDSSEWLRAHHEGSGCRQGARRVCDGYYSLKKCLKSDYLEHFEMRCPPGCEEKVVLYFTSLRGVRKTFEECCTLRMVLKGFGVQVDERDVWMHARFRQELTHVMGKAMSVPRLFIKGRYIGGIEEVKQLHEEGVLSKLLEGLPIEWNDICSLCGGVRFVLCSTCRGSCKVFTFDQEVKRCPDCNENGLSMCPSCGW